MQLILQPLLTTPQIMTEQVIDLMSWDFWIALLCAILFVGPITHKYFKECLWATLNCCFVMVILQLNGLFMLLAICSFFISLRTLNGKYKKLTLFVIAISLSILFSIHKSSIFIEFSILTPIKSILIVTGFSYILLRMIDITRAVFEGRHAPPSLIVTINYLIPFHMLAAGPIQSYDDFIEFPIKTTSPNAKVTLESVERIVLGLFKKFVLAYLIQKTFLTNFESNGIYFVLEVQFFLIWLYLDFSAYSDIAIGIGRLLGISTPENFNKPYLARNASDFWARWHISLSLFIQRHIFIPLQLLLNRKYKAKRPILSASVAFTLSFVVCGMWHGLTINFILWGAIHAFALVIHNLYKVYLKKKIGREGMKSYLSNKFLLYLARFLTYEYVAFSLVVLFLPL